MELTEGPIIKVGAAAPQPTSAGGLELDHGLITLGLELSSAIFKFLRQDEVERVVLEIAKISTVPIEKRDAVIQEAYQRAIALKYINEGGIEYAKEILERSFGTGQADDMTNKL